MLQPTTFELHINVIIGGIKQHNYSKLRINKFNRISIEHNNQLQIANKIVADFIGITQKQQQQQLEFNMNNKYKQTLLSSLLFSSSSFILNSFLSFSSLFNLFYRHRKAFRRKNNDYNPNNQIQNIQQPFCLNLSKTTKTSLLSILIMEANIFMPYLLLSSYYYYSYYYCIEVGRRPFSLGQRLFLLIQS
jgi:hypothetical protein